MATLIQRLGQFVVRPSTGRAGLDAPSSVQPSARPRTLDPILTVQTGAGLRSVPDSAPTEPTNSGVTRGRTAAVPQAESSDPLEPGVTRGRTAVVPQAESSDPLEPGVTRGRTAVVP